MAFVGFNAKTVAPSSSSFELLPRGRYLVSVIDSELKTNAAKTGEYLKLTFEILEGSYKGRKLFDQLNIRHPNTKAVEIALSTLSSICHAVDVLELGDSSALHNLPLLAEVGVQKGNDGYEDRNRIYSYHSAKDGAPTPMKNTSLPAQMSWGTKPASSEPIRDDDVPF